MTEQLDNDSSVRNIVERESSWQWKTETEKERLDFLRPANHKGNNIIMVK